MATKKQAQPETLRRCIGSVKFGIEAHDAPVSDFPSQPSQKDGLGRMCRIHWKEYTSALRRASTPPKAAPAAVAEVERATTDKAAAKATKTGKAKPAAKPETSRHRKPTGQAPEASATAEHDATVRAEAAATTPDPEAAEQDAILVERKSRVKGWRRQEAEKALAGS